MLKLQGQRFGRLVVLDKAGNKGSNVLWACECDCGNHHEVIGRDLKNGRTKSCGCLRKEITGDRVRTHGNRDSRLYSIWSGMKARCKSDRPEISKYYKDRNIMYCNEWADYINFENDMKSSYESHVVLHGEHNTSIDRIDSNKGYNKENCRWATNQVQNINQRPHLKINTVELMNIFLQELSSINETPTIVVTSEQFDYISERMRNKYGKRRKF